MLILIKGAGDLATGVAHRLKRCGFDIVMTEISKPTTVRRTISFSQAVYDGSVEVEGIKAILVNNIKDIKNIIHNGNIPVIIDKTADIVKQLKPDVVIDAIIAKKKLGTSIHDAPIVIALGPGFNANVDCHCVIETQRGHYLGKCIYDGEALPNTGIPGDIAGFTEERIIRATTDGIITPIKQIGDYVYKGDIVAYINTTKIKANVNGIIRGMLKEGLQVYSGMKCGDIDPRCEKSHCFTISDKARSISGGVLEAILYLNKEHINK